MGRFGDGKLPENKLVDLTPEQKYALQTMDDPKQRRLMEQELLNQ